MTRLEQRYRRLLRLLPSWYRADREEEMVDVFLLADAARHSGGAEDEQDDWDYGDHEDLRGEYGWPDRREFLAVAGLAVRTRFGGVGAPSAARARGDTVRTIALLGVLVRAVLALVSVGSLVHVQLRSGVAFADSTTLLSPLGGYVFPTLLLNLVWVPAYLLLVLGKRRAGMLCSGVALLPSLLSMIPPDNTPATSLTSVITGVGIWLPVVCVFLGFHRDAPEPSRKPWLLALPVGVLAALIFILLGWLVPPVVVAGPRVCGLLVVAVFTLVVRLRSPGGFRVPGRPRWRWSVRCSWWNTRRCSSPSGLRKWCRCSPSSCRWRYSPCAASSWRSPPPARHPAVVRTRSV
ncbi:hypothetical protein SAMN04487819_102146 [Actinopolyspora alba]|uniref:Uncharacterized protein n=1 Tax=Actinopolyspora alba TaxID=673379 RepID=A0A1I1UEY7_9ACTN|nr:hypothetical protein [Actinopolyspora alba]SFD69416.1 hypothetical protein SAMN04487819_102146 [Actinopolyspora alba]